MKARGAPRFEERRKEEFAAELHKRAQAWIPSWDISGGERDFGHALLEIAARFNSEVAERLDNVGEKMRRGFLDWLAVRGIAAKPSRLPVVFKLADAAQEPVLASAPVQLQAEADGSPVVFETEKDLRVVPGRLDEVVGVDTDKDAFFFPPPGLSDLTPLEPLPTQWVLKSYASSGATKLQLNPDAGLKPNMIIEAAGQQYRIVQVDNEIVTIEPALAAELPQSSMVRKVTTFAPFDGAAINRQEHALYLGHMDLLNIESAATIEVVGATTLRTDVTWQYWGKVEGNDEIGWQPLTLSADQQVDAVVLEKTNGSVEPREIGGTSSRWIRAFLKAIENTSSPLLQADALELRVNCKHGAIPCPPNSPSRELSPAAEAIANTTPLVLDSVFFPLGKEPRQFDAFYLGSEEAFSKKGAKVQLCFEMADPSFLSLTSLRSGAKANSVLAGVAADGQLYLFQFIEDAGSLIRLPNHVPLHPPTPLGQGASASQDGPALMLDPRPAFRVPLWQIGMDLFVAVAAKGTVWLWRENASNLGGWLPLDVVGPVPDPAKLVDGLVYLADGAQGLLFALRDSTLFVRNLNMPNARWQLVQTMDGATEVSLVKIAPICLEAGDRGNGTLAEGIVGVSRDNKLYSVALSGTPLQGTCTKLLDDISSEVAPSAIRRADNRLVAVAVDTQTPQHLVAFRSDQATFGFDTNDDVTLDGLTVIGKLLDMNFNATTLTAVLSLADESGSTVLASWVPFTPAGLDGLSKVKIPGFFGAAAGAPTLMPKHVLLPTSKSQVIVAGFDLTSRIEVIEFLHTAIIATDASDRFAVKDRLAIPRDGGGGVTEYVLQEVTTTGVEFHGKMLYEFKNIAAIDKPLFAYRFDAPELSGTVIPSHLRKIKIDAGDPEPDPAELLLVTTDLSTALYSVKSYNSRTRVAKLDRELDVVDRDMPPGTVAYVLPERSSANILPLLRLDPSTTGNWQASVLNRTNLFFPGADPEFQQGIAYKIDAGKPELVVLGEHWKTKPPVIEGKVKFSVDGTVGEWTEQLGDTSTNPELSWEYWNGKGWWGLDVKQDTTLHLKRTGVVRFEVPPDIASGDWAGKTNFWIRARLIGGDYGRETVTVETEEDGKKTKQTIHRSIEGIRPPSVVQLHISYSVCEAVQPTYVLSQDSGSMRDQSDANRTAGAIVEAFVPLALTLGRLSHASTPTAISVECPPECRCHGEKGTGIGASIVTNGQPPVSNRRMAGRALFIGLDATVSGAPVSVLLLVEKEQDHSGLLPLKIEALVADRFIPIVADDGTRAVGESGLLTMAFTVPPTRGELFGKTLTWLRLSPRAGTDTTQWKPSLRGAYLNAVWASATETLTRELVGSSNGSPNLTMRLARPPVLHGTLELRVKEPLGDEERVALRKDDARRVLSDVQDLLGDWVLWKQVTDPGDEPAAERVYAFDEAKGEIRFGDGQHGMIPPIGRDSIVAFSYQRTEPPKSGSDTVPGNLIAPRTALNLVSSIESVEAVTAADGAAGGAPPEPDDRVLRFGFSRLRHRNRAVTSQDLEDMALQSSPDIAQARCFVRRGFVRLVIVMRGKNPIPNTAQIRELHRLLIDGAPPALSEQKALQIVVPSIRRLRVRLTLLVESLEHAGALSEEVERRLMALFDTTSGGSDGDGWALGVNPNEEDLALALINAKHLESLIQVKFLEVADDGIEQIWPVALKPVELVVLDTDPARIEFVTAGVMA